MSSRPHLARSVRSSCLLVRFRFSARLRAHFSPLMAVVLVDLPSVSYPLSNLGGEAARNCGSSVWRRKCIWSYSLLLSSLPPLSHSTRVLAATSLLFRQKSLQATVILHTRHRGACTWRPLSHFGRTPSVEDGAVGVTVLGVALTLPQLFSLSWKAGLHGVHRVACGRVATNRSSAHVSGVSAALSQWPYGHRETRSLRLFC